MDTTIQSNQEAENAIDALIDADNGHLKELPLSSIIAAGFTQQGKLIEKLTALTLDTEIIPGDQRQDVADMIEKNQNLVKAIKVQNLFTNKDDTGMESFASGEDLITPLYVEARENLIHSISDASCKHLSTFSGEEATGAEMDLVVERFLSLGFRIAQQANLTHKCCLGMLTRKLTKTAKLIFESWINQNDITEDALDLKTFCHFLEKKFCLFSSVKSANLQLASLGSIKNFEYLQMVGKISRLCKLATREIKDREQKMLVANTKALECFRSTLSDSDRSFIVSQDRMRQEQHKPALTMHKAAELLAQRHADSIQHSLLSQSSSSANVVQEVTNQDGVQKEDSQEPDCGNDQINQPALWINNNNRERQNRGRTNFRMRPPAMNYPRQNFNPRLPPRNNFQQPRFNSQPQPQNYQFRQQFRQSYPNRFQSRRGNYNRPNFNPNQTPRINPNQTRLQGVSGPERRPHITSEMVNVPDGFCKMCAKPGHRYYDKSCEYFGRSQLFPKECPICHQGGHSKNSCLQRRPNRFAQEHEEDNDSIDNFLSHLQGGSKN